MAAPERRFDRMRVDHVGSLLRPADVKQAFAQAARGEVSEAQRRAVEDESIRECVARQESIGLPVVTDGEFRRTVFMESFADVAGFEQWKAGWTSLITALGEEREEQEAKYSERGLDPVLVVREPATERLRLTRNRPLEDWQFVAGASSDPSRASVTLIGPDRISQGFDPGRLACALRIDRRVRRRCGRESRRRSSMD